MAGIRGSADIFSLTNSRAGAGRSVDYNGSGAGDDRLVYTAISTAAVIQDTVKPSAGRIFKITVFSLDATPVYLKLYNKATDPTGADTPVWREGIGPAAATGARVELDFPEGREFSTGIGVRITTGIADNDTGALSANEVLLNIEYL